MENIILPFTVEFANTTNDWIAWNKYVLKNNIDNAKTKLALISSVPAIFMSLIYTPIYFLREADTTAITAILGSLIMLFYSA